MHVEVKLMETDRGEVSWQIGVPLGCVIQRTNGDGSAQCIIDPQAPVAWRYYSPGHAHSAVLKRAYFEDQLFVFDEDYNEVRSDTWRGMRYEMLSRITDQANLHISTSWFAAKTAEQTFSRKRLDMPAYVIQQESMKAVGGSGDDSLQRDVGYSSRVSGGLIATLVSVALCMNDVPVSEAYYNCDDLHQHWHKLWARATI